MASLGGLRGDGHRRVAGERRAWMLGSAKSLLTHAMVAGAVFLACTGQRLAGSVQRDNPSAARAAAAAVAPSCVSAPQTSMSIDDRLSRALTAEAGAKAAAVEAAKKLAAAEAAATAARAAPVLSAPAAQPQRGPVNGPFDWAPPKPHPWRTEQLCYILSDDSEICVYDGPICYAGNSQVAVAAAAPSVALGAHDDGHSTCGDRRNWEEADDCAYSIMGSQRRWRPSWTGSMEDKMVAASLDAAEIPSQPIHGTERIWGPAGRNLNVGHVPPRFIIDASTPSDIARLGADWAEGVAAARAESPNMRDLLSPFVTPTNITWLSGTAWIVYLTHDSWPHPWHMAAATFQLWAARRMNATGGIDGRGTRIAEKQAGWWKNRASPLGTSDDWAGFRYTHSSGIVLPTMDTLVMPSLYVASANMKTLTNYSRSTLRLLTPPGVQFLLPRDLNETMSISPTSWLCAKSGVMIGEKTRLFTGPGDAHAWRIAAYAVAGVEAPAWPTHPPRTVTIIVRERFRNFLNHQAVLQYLSGWGLPVTVVYWASKLTWEEQVKLYANTGILIASHGAALTNMMYMPVHSVALEIFPYKGVVPLYRRLAENARVTYYSIYSRRASREILDFWKDREEGLDLQDAPEYIETCENIPLSSTDAPLTSLCDMGGKRSQLEVPLDDFARVISMAMDDIGCKDSICRIGQNKYINVTHAARRAGGPVYDEFKVAESQWNHPGASMMRDGPDGVMTMNGREMHPDPK